MIYPKFIKSGDCIGVPAPSSGAYDEPHIRRYENAKRKLEKMGFNIIDIRPEKQEDGTTDFTRCVFLFEGKDGLEKAIKSLK